MVVAVLLHLRYEHPYIHHDTIPHPSLHSFPVFFRCLQSGIFGWQLFRFCFYIRVLSHSQLRSPWSRPLLFTVRTKINTSCTLLGIPPTLLFTNVCSRFPPFQRQVICPIKASPLSSVCSPLSDFLSFQLPLTGSTFSCFFFSWNLVTILGHPWKASTLRVPKPKPDQSSCVHVVLCFSGGGLSETRRGVVAGKGGLL